MSLWCVSNSAVCFVLCRTIDVLCYELWAFSDHLDRLRDHAGTQIRKKECVTVSFMFSHFSFSTKQFFFYIFAYLYRKKSKYMNIYREKMCSSLKFRCAKEFYWTQWLKFWHWYGQEWKEWNKEQMLICPGMFSQTTLTKPGYLFPPAANAGFIYV